MHFLEKAFHRLRTLALAYPETREDHPWGETAIKVKAKTFLFMGYGEKKLRLSLKLTDRHEFALQYPFVSPTRYGLGKSGWITASFSGTDRPPMDILAAWIDDSYRAIAPKRLAAKLGAAVPVPRSG
ncbi:MAG TPA: MmcQ/YjbR family DNA-binding protein [Rhizomicrobium sp.]